MMYTFSFEKMDVWIQAKELTIQIYALTRNYPNDEQFGLVSQMRRASGSVCCNLAEGSARKTKNDQAHFYTMAYGSLMEVLNLCSISLDLNNLPDLEYQRIRKRIETISHKIYLLKTSVQRK